MRDAWEIARLTAAELGTAYADGSLTPTEVVDAALVVVDDAEPEINALWDRADESARVAAQESTQRWRRGEARGPLDGVPATVKENLARAGVPMPAGNAGVVPVVPERSSPVVERLTEAGAVIVGSTVMPDWGMLSSGVSSLHGITQEPLGPGADDRRVVVRRWCGRRGGLRRPQRRHGHRRVDPAARARGWAWRRSSPAPAGYRWTRRTSAGWRVR